jgi:hypothetical protein
VVVREWEEKGGWTDVWRLVPGVGHVGLHREERVGRVFVGLREFVVVTVRVDLRDLNGGRRRRRRRFRYC